MTSRVFQLIRETARSRPCREPLTLFALFPSSRHETLSPYSRFFRKALGIKAHWKHEDGDGRLVHAEVLWGSDPISITAGEPRRCSLGLEVEDEATVERLFERALSASAQIEMGLTHSKVAYSFTVQDSEGNQY